MNKIYWLVITILDNEKGKHMDGIKKVKFKDCDINSVFFNSLREDYDGFDNWFNKKVQVGEEAHIIEINNKIEGFLYLKYNEIEKISIKNDLDLPLEPRLKIGTLKTTETIQGRRFGEGFIGIALWEWARSSEDTIYVTTYPKQASLIGMLEAFGFINAGELLNSKGEYLYYKSKKNINYESPRKSFPYIEPSSNGKILIINEEYHDTLFPYSKLKHGIEHKYNLDVRNGVTKSFVTAAYQLETCQPGDIALIYRKANESPQYRSCVTSICTIEKIIVVKKYNTWKKTSDCIYDFEKFKNILGNKTVLSEATLAEFYNNKTVIVLEVLYNYFLGEGKNLNYKTLKANDLWSTEGYPYNKDYNVNDIKRIMELSENDVQNIIID